MQCSSSSSCEHDSFIQSIANLTRNGTKKVLQRELWWVVHWPKPRSTQKQLERFKERTSRIWIRTVITNQHRMWRLVETYCEAMACCCQNPTAMASETALIYAWIFLDRLSHHNKKNALVSKQTEKFRNEFKYGRLQGKSGVDNIYFLSFFTLWRRLPSESCLLNVSALLLAVQVGGWLIRWSGIVTRIDSYQGITSSWIKLMHVYNFVFGGYFVITLHFSHFSSKSFDRSGSRLERFVQS